MPKTATKPEPAAAALPPSIPYAGGYRTAEPASIAIADIIVDEMKNDRDARSYDTPQGATALNELAETMHRLGQLQPVGVRRLPDDKRKTQGGALASYELVFGFRRMRAANMLKWTHINAVVVPADVSDADARLTENLHREALSDIEKADAVCELYDRNPDLVPDDERVAAIAARLGQSERWVRDHLYIARMSKPIRELIRSGQLPATHARVIARLADAKVREDIARQAAAEEPGRLPMELDQVKDLVTRRMLSLADVAWDKAVNVPGVQAPACNTCPANSANDMQLFGGKGELPAAGDLYDKMDGGTGRRSKDDDGPYCGNPTCYKAKAAAAEKALKTAATAIVNAVEKTEAPLNIKMLQESRLVPAGVSAEAALSAARIRRAEKSVKAAERSADRSETNYLPEYEVNYRVNDAIRNANHERVEQYMPYVEAALTARPEVATAMTVMLFESSFSDTLLAKKPKYNRYAPLSQAHWQQRLRLIAEPDIGELGKIAMKAKSTTSSPESIVEAIAELLADTDNAFDKRDALRKALNIAAPLPPAVDEKVIRLATLQKLIDSKKIARPKGWVDAPTAAEPAQAPAAKAAKPAKPVKGKVRK
ncbi:MAG: ParB/RepB/Spo0J family partition protein [Planctomyces sp.]